MDVDALIAGATANLTVWEGGGGNVARVVGVRTSIDHGRLRLLQEEEGAPDTLRTTVPLAMVEVGLEVGVVAGQGAIDLGIDVTLEDVVVEVAVRGARGGVRRCVAVMRGVPGVVCPA